MNQEKIKEQAKVIMDEFVKALDNAGVDISGDVGIERKSFVRKGKKEKYGEDFKKRILENAPKKSDGQILTEKKNW
jgi:Asp-tRNA(Asn)/Glu-tRNA(Gln) amidotransferase C subunit